MKVPSYLALGALNRETLMAALLLTPLAVATTLLSVRVVRRIDPEKFYTIVHVLLVLLGAKLIWDGLA